MEDIQNQEVTNYGDQLRSRMQSKYPDRDFGGQVGQEGQGGTGNLEQAVIEYLDEMEGQVNDLTAQQDTYRQNTDRLTALFNNSPRSMVFLNTLASTGNPSEAIYKAYGKEAYDAFRDGDASEFIANIEAEDAKMRAENEQLEAEKAANLKASFADLDAWGDEKGLDEDGKVQVFMRFYDILSDALMGKYSRDLFEMGWKADNYDADVENARREGEVTGRNAKINERAVRRREQSALPPTLNGQGVRANETPVQKPTTEGDFWEA